MNIEEIREYCLFKKGVSEGLPFGDDTLVFKVMGKMFMLMNLDGDLTVNVKCDPGKALELREEYDAVIPGYHMNKQHWNTINVVDAPSDKLLQEWMNDSYELVVEGLSRKLKEELGITT